MKDRIPSSKNYYEFFFSYPPIYTLISGILIGIITNILANLDSSIYLTNIKALIILLLLILSCGCFTYIGLTLENFRRILEQKNKLDNEYYNQYVEGEKIKLYLSLFFAVFCLVFIGIVQFVFFGFSIGNIPTNITYSMDV